MLAFLLHAVLAVAPPAEETTWSFREETELDLDFLRSFSNGRLTERRDFQAHSLHVAERRLVDRAVGDDGSILRHYAKVAHELVLDIEERNKPVRGEASGTGELSDSRVLFEPGADGESQAVLVGEDGEPIPGSEAPAGLVAAITAADFLPAEDAAEEWDVPVESLRQLLRPGGDLEFLFGDLNGAEDPDLLAFYGGLCVARAVDELEGEVRARVAPAAEGDGGDTLRVVATFDVAFACDPAEWMHEQSAPHEMAKIGQTARDASIEGLLQGTGVLLFDAKTRRLRRAEFESDTEFVFSTHYSFTISGFKVEGDYKLELSGASTSVLEREGE